MYTPESKQSNEALLAVIKALSEQVKLMSGQLATIQAEVMRMSSQMPNYEIDKSIKPIPADAPQLQNQIFLQRWNLQATNPYHLKIIEQNIHVFVEFIGTRNLNAILGNIATIRSLNELEQATTLTRDQNTTKYQCGYYISLVLTHLEAMSG